MQLWILVEVVDFYTMTEIEKDEITKKICEGRAAKMIMKHGKLAEIEKYYEKVVAGGNDYQVE